MRIVFMGTPEFAIPTLRTLADAGHEVVAVVTAPDKPSGRGLQVKPSPVKEYALERGLHILQPEKLKNQDFLDELAALKPELAIVVAFRMLPEVVWRIPSKGTLNLHAALLPDYRGAAPINWAIINGETKTGATTFFIDQQIDTGDILLQTEINLPEDWTAGDLYEEMMERGANLVLETVAAIEANAVVPKPQNEIAFIHPAPKIFKEDCRINWSQSAKKVHDFIRGMSPYPTAWTTIDGKSLKIFKSTYSTENKGNTTGEIVLEGKKELWVQCANGAIKIEELQLEGKKRMETASFLLGFKEDVGHVQ